MAGQRFRRRDPAAARLRSVDRQNFGVSKRARDDILSYGQEFGREPPNPELMSSSQGPLRPATLTEIIVVTGDRYRVHGDAKATERIVLDAARGSIMQLAWLVEAETGEDLAVNPRHVVILRSVDS